MWAASSSQLYPWLGTLGNSFQSCSISSLLDTFYCLSKLISGALQPLPCPPKGISMGQSRDLATPLPLLCFPGFTFGEGITWITFRGCSIIGVGLFRSGKSGHCRHESGGLGGKGLVGDAQRECKGFLQLSRWIWEEDGACLDGGNGKGTSPVCACGRMELRDWVQYKWKRVANVGRGWACG